MIKEKLISLVSLGPGDPELMTLKTVRRLKEADIVFCPGTESVQSGLVSRAAALVGSAGVPEERIRVFAVPMERERKTVLEVYRQVASEIVTCASNGHRVAVAVEGDAGIYASIHYMMEAIQAEGYPVEQCCGVPSFIAASAEAGLLLVGREERLVVIPGNVTETELATLLANGQIPVVMKLPRCREAVCSFMKCHPEYSYHYFENVGSSTCYYTSRPEEIQDRAFPYFSLMIIRP